MNPDTPRPGHHSNPGVQDQLEYEKAKERRFPPIANGEPQEVHWDDGEYEEKMKKMRESQQEPGAVDPGGHDAHAP